MSDELPVGLKNPKFLLAMATRDLSTACDELREVLKHDTISRTDRSKVAELFAGLTINRAFRNSRNDNAYEDKDLVPDLDSVFEDLVKLQPGMSRCFYLGTLGIALYQSSFQQEDAILLERAARALKIAIEFSDEFSDEFSSSTLNVTKSLFLPLPTGLSEGVKDPLGHTRTFYVHTLGSVKQRLHKFYRESEYLDEAKELFEECWADAGDRGPDAITAGLALAKCYDIIFFRDGDYSLLHKGMSVLDEILLFPIYRTQALVFQCGFRLRLWPNQNDAALLHWAIEVAESIRSDVDVDQGPVHLGNLMNLYLERSWLFSDIKDLDKAFDVATDALDMANSMVVGQEISETDKLIAQARARAERGRCVIMLYQHTQDTAFLYEATRLAAESIHLSQQLGNQDPNSMFHPEVLVSLRCHLSRQTGEERDLTESIEWIERALLSSKSPGGRVALQSDLCECLSTRYCSNVERYEDDLQQVMRLGSEIRKAGVLSSTLAQAFMLIYKRNYDLDVLNQAIDFVSGEGGHDPLVRAEALLERTRRLSGQNWTKDAAEALERLQQYICAQTRSSSTFIIAVMFLSDPIFISNRKLEMSYLASKTKEAVRQLPSAVPRALTRQDVQKILRMYVGLATTAAASAIAVGHGADEALELLEGGRGILATYLLDSRVGSFQFSGSKLSEVEDALAASLKDKSAQLELAVRSDGMIAPEQRCHVYRAHKLDLEIREILEKLQPSQEQASQLLRPLKAADMKAGFCNGAIVVINISSFRCDSIIVHQGKIWNLPLPLLTEASAKIAARCLDALRKPPASRSRRTLRGFISSVLLSWLWKVAVEPILDDLGFTGTPSPESCPRVWWVPTGILSKLPFHAAGIHMPGSSSSALDRVISSYSSSIGSLLFTRNNIRDKDPKSSHDPMVIVPMSKTKGKSSLHFVDGEVCTIKSVLDQVQSFKIRELKPPNRKDDVLDALSTCNIFHFAGHGASFIEDPDRGCLLLDDWEENPLAVRDILSLNFRHRAPWLAYLSACSTGTNQTNELRDEGIHLVGAYQLAGFQHVIGTFWEVSDYRSREVAGDFYSYLRDNGIGQGHNVALALHLAIRKLRDPRDQDAQSTNLNTVTSDLGNRSTAPLSDMETPEVSDAENMNGGDEDGADLNAVLQELCEAGALGDNQEERDEFQDQFKDEFRDGDLVPQNWNWGRKGTADSMLGRTDPMFWAPYFHVGL